MKIALYFSIAFILIVQKVYGQNLISDNALDTLSVDKLGTKIELENDLVLGEKWNLEILKVAKFRKNLKSIPKAHQLYYENAYQSSLLNQGYYEKRRGNIKKEIEYYFEVLKTANIKDNAKVLAYTYQSIGGAYSLEGEYQKGLTYFSQALKIANKIADLNLTGILYGSIAYTYKRMSLYDKSLENYLKRLEISQKVKNSNYAGITLYNIAQIYTLKKDYEKANYYLDKSIIESKKLNDLEQLSETYFEINKIFKIKNNRPLAEKYLLEAYNYGVKSANLLVLGKIGGDVSNYYKEKKNYSKAMEALEYAISAKDSLNKEDNKNAILKAAFKYETEKKEAEIRSLSQLRKIAQLEASQKNNLIYSILGGVLLLSIIAYFSFTKFKANKQKQLLETQLQEANFRILAEQKATESELKALKSQMNPHFMFNALNSIQEQFMYGDKTSANEQMGNFTALTRQILEVSGKKKINLSTEVDILEKYLALEKMRFSTDFEYKITMNHTLDEDYHQLPPMLIQPFVENAVKHGLLHKKGMKTIIVNFELSKDENVSFSTAATESRLQLLASQVGIEPQSNLIVISDLINETGNTSGTMVEISIPT